MRAFVLLALLFQLALTAPVSALTLEVCNSGEETIFIAHAESSFNSPYRAVGGWTELTPNRCWRREAPKMDRMSILAAYVDGQGRLGAVQFNPDFRAGGQYSLSRGPYSFCVHPKDGFFRGRVRTAGARCPHEMVRVKFPFYISGQKGPGALARLKIAVKRGTLHEDYAVIPWEPEEAPPDPQEERYANSGRIDLLRGPSARQIEAAEYRNLQLRMQIANALILKDAKLKIHSLDLDRCLSTKDGPFYCRYKLDAQIEASKKMRPMAQLLNLGFLFKGYYWSSFTVSRGRWVIVKQYEGCRVSDVDIRCWSRK
ncbi:hypothetical protein [Nitratireductor rhodophyticola]|uniref:hypothetical protein n=1 Tax=Nitratireductor rhodophyticola TaxID=2854036 RepID=UPI0030091293